jgi:hypothetical protein
VAVGRTLPDVSDQTPTAGSGGSGGSGGGSAPRREQAPRYSREELPDYVAAPPHVVVAALVDDERETFTVKQAEDAVEKFLAHEDESEMAQPEPEPDEEA